jgi:hypothetical protein
MRADAAARAPLHGGDGLRVASEDFAATEPKTPASRPSTSLTVTPGWGLSTDRPPASAVLLKGDGLVEARRHGTVGGLPGGSADVSGSRSAATCPRRRILSGMRLPHPLPQGTCALPARGTAPREEAGGRGGLPLPADGGRGGARRAERGRARLTAIRQGVRPAQSLQSSIRRLSVERNCAASAPSRARWSQDMQR